MIVRIKRNFNCRTARLRNSTARRLEPRTPYLTDVRCCPALRLRNPNSSMRRQCQPRKTLILCLQRPFHPRIKKGTAMNIKGLQKRPRADGSSNCRAPYESASTKKRSIKRDSAVLREMDPFIGHLPLSRTSDASFDDYRLAQKHVSIRTRNQKLALAGRVLELAATVWCFTNTNLTWLNRAPEILTESGHRARVPYPLNAQEQQLLLSELDFDAVQMATFAINITPQTR
jgi:hypothetical protein